MKTNTLIKKNSINTVQPQHECGPNEGSCGQPLILMVDATNQCQLGCEYCYFGNKDCNFMNPYKLFKAISNFISAQNYRISYVNIHYMGGEPLLGWKQIVTLNQAFTVYAAKNNLDFDWSLTSNLIALDENKRDVMVKEKAHIHCSIDGPQFIQDKNRPLRNGQGSFLFVDKNIDLALQISPNDVVRVTVTPFSSHHLPKITSYLFDKGFKKIGLFPAYNQDWQHDDYISWSKGLKKSFAIAKERGGTINTIVSHRATKKTTSFSYCGAGKTLWAFDVNGNLYHCHHLTNNKEYKIINAAESTVAKIKQALKLTTISPQIISLPEKCEDCPVANNCNGGCWSDNLLHNGDKYMPDSVPCTFQKITYESIKEYLIEPTTNLDHDIDNKATTSCWFSCDKTCQSCDRGECYSCENTCMTHHDHYDRWS